MRRNGGLDKLIDVIPEEGREYVTGTWYNYVMEMGQHIEDQLDEVTQGMREFGMQAFDWDYMYELLTKEP